MAKKWIFLIGLLLWTYCIPVFGSASTDEIKTLSLKLVDPRTNMEINLKQGMKKPNLPLQFQLYATYESGVVKEIKKDIEWILNDKDIAQIDGSGYVFFLDKEGFFSVEAQYGGKRAVYYTSVKWQIASSEITQILVKGNFEYHKEGRELNVYGKTITGELFNLEGEEISYSSSDSTIGEVVNHKLYFTGKIGSATITVSYEKWNTSFSIEVKESDLSRIPVIIDVIVEPEFPTSLDPVSFHVITDQGENQIVKEEWNGKKRFFKEGIYLPSLRVQNDLGYLSDWYEIPLLIGGYPTEEKAPFSEAIVDVKKLRVSIFQRIMAKNQDRKIQEEVKNHWAASSIMTGIQLAYLTKYQDGSFQPNRYMNRSELSASLSLAFGFLPVDNYVFYDIETDPNKGYIYALYERGIINGYENGSFSPQKAISRGEFANLIFNLLDSWNGYELSFSENYFFSDVEGYWGKDAIENVAQMGLMTGGTDGRFRPKDPITRGECMVVLERLLKKDPLIQQALSLVPME